MVTIIRHQNTCKIITDGDDADFDHDLMQELDELLSFQIPGAEFSPYAKPRINQFGEYISWDLKRHLLNGNGSFASGFYNKVYEFLLSKGIIPIVKDERPTQTPGNPIDIIPRLHELGLVPRPYQLSITETAIAYDRGIIKASTAAGKTVIMALITAKIGKSALILVIGTDLLYQTHKVFTDLFQTDIGIIGDGNCVIKDINIASIWTIGKVLETKDAIVLADSEDKEKEVSKDRYQDIRNMLNSSRTVIFDECQMCGCNTALETAKYLKNFNNLYGMSASPWRDDGADLLIESILGQRIVDLSARQLIDEGYLVEPVIKFLAPDPYPYKSGNYQKIYSKYIIENEQRNGMVVKAALKMIEQGFFPLVLFNNIKHGDILYDIIKQHVPVVLLSGKDSSKVREQAKKDIEGGKVKCVIASKVYDTGVDIKCLSGLVVASAGKSSIKAIQRIGRVIRPYPGKRIAAVIDFADQAPYLCSHANRRREMYETEFKVQWPATIPKEKANPVETP